MRPSASGDSDNAKFVVFTFLYFHSRCGLPAQSDFFKDKQMKIVVGASAGAASDLYARVVANFLPKQIPGRPEIIVQNMPGGGSLTAANYVYSVAKPDGLTLGAVTAPIYFAQLLGERKFSSTGRSLPGSARRRKTTSCFSCARISPTRPCSICAKLLNRRAAAPRESAAPDITFRNCWKKCSL